MQAVPFHASVRARLVLVSLALLVIPLAGWLFVRELTSYLREAQVQVTTAAAKLAAASLSDRPGLRLRRAAQPPTQNQIAREVPSGTPPTQDAALVEPNSAPAKPSSENEIDPTERERIIALFGASDAGVAASLGSRYQPDAAVERILGQGVSRDARVWVVDLAGNVRGIAGALHKAESSNSRDQLRVALFRLMLPASAGIVSANVAEAHDAVLLQADRALLGQANAEWRVQADDRLAVLSVAEPVWQGDAIVAALVLEQSDSGPRALASRATERVILLSFAISLAAFAVLAWFALGLTQRLTRLQRDAHAAIDAEGRVKGSISHSGAADEIGALTRTLEAMIARQAGYNRYLEALAARLSHELRTPVAVVRSSLDNLRAQAIDDTARTYLARADEGVSRLTTLIARMSEATQLERMLATADRESFDLVTLVESAVAGYALAFREARFEFQPSESAITYTGVPDALVQMLDKLVANAVDFATAETPIRIQLRVVDADEVTGLKDMRTRKQVRFVELTVENQGPALPADATSLFESMVSARSAEHSGGVHLGLGLYIARLTAEFHGGNIRAENRPTGDGVIMTVTLPLSSIAQP
jgi:signal transduction histidine kinase